MAQEKNGSGEPDDFFRRPSGRASIEIKVKGSRFLAEVLPAQDAESAQAGLAAIRRRAHDATHHCSAWRTGAAGTEFRVDDDGEPSGSAGWPILRQIDAAGLTNTLVVVTRWFGGTKLGTGGLVRAYGDAAREALSLAPVEECLIRVRFDLSFAFEDTSPAMHTVAKHGGEILETRYAVGTSMMVAVRRSLAAAFEEGWVESLRGRGSIARIPNE